MRNVLYICFIICMVISGCLCKAGRGGSSSRVSSFSSRSSSSSHSKPSGSSGWSFSKSVPSYRPAPSYKPTLASAPSYGWNTANPGLHNKPVSSYDALSRYPPSYIDPPAINPPAYSGHSDPSYNHPTSIPSYSGRRYYVGRSYNSHPNYGSTFGSSGLPSNTYIYKNYYGSTNSGSSFLTNALFYHHSGRYNAHKRRWSNKEDRRWRRTTKAPYFENKVPGSETILPAAAVVGAATAFGLVSLLPLNVPAHKALMYCNATDIVQSHIKFKEMTYQCVNGTVELLCLKQMKNGTIVNKCEGVKMKCNVKNNVNILYCTKGTLLSRVDIFCNSTTVKYDTLINGTTLNETSVNESATVLNCYEGILPQSQSAFIPTTSTEAPTTTTTEKSLSFSAKMQIFLLNLLGKLKVLETTTITPDIPKEVVAWIPEALPLSPETTIMRIITPTTTESTTTSTEEPFQWHLKTYHQLENGTMEVVLIPLSNHVFDFLKKNAIEVTMNPVLYTKVPITKSLEPTSSTEAVESKTTSESS